MNFAPALKTPPRHVSAFGLVVLLSVVATVRGALAADSTAPRDESRVLHVLQGDGVRVEVTVAGGALEERFLAQEGDRWAPVAVAAGDQTSGPTAVVLADGTVLRAQVERVSLRDGALIEEFGALGHRIVRRIELAGGPWLKVVTRLEPGPVLTVRSIADRFRFLADPDWCFSPSVGGFNPDAQYKAPLILVQAGGLACGLVPDLASLDLAQLRRSHHALDLDVPSGPLLAVGLMPARQVSHSVFGPDAERTWMAAGPVENAYYLLLSASSRPGQAFREAVRLHWERFGRSEQAKAAAQQTGTDARYRELSLWDAWRDKVWLHESKEQWLQVPLADGKPGGGVATKRWGPGPSVYLTSWFNSLRTSYGMALYARRSGNTRLLELAQQTVRLALGAPGRDGAFKCIAVPNGDAVVWAAGDGGGESTERGYLGYDMSWTGYWLLQWRRAGLPAAEGILERSEALARFLVARQRPDGMLPTHFEEDGSVSLDRSLLAKAETGPVVLFLLELYAQRAAPDFLAAARRGLAFLEREVIPNRQWYDYETFWSCSPRQAVFDRRSQQWPANNLALGQSVAAFLQAFRVTGEPGYLSTGERLLDYLLLYQQCWTNPTLEQLSGPAMLLGGFTTQNSDAEWSDARQSQFGNVLLDYYRATGRAEYLERGIAALRAQFPISPSENWAHGGYGGKAGVSSFHWGTGSGMAGIELEEEYLRDAVVDVASARGVGVNGTSITGCGVEGGAIRFTFTTPFDWARRPVVVFRRTLPAGTYRVIVNGTEVGQWLGKELEAGISLAARREP